MFKLILTNGFEDIELTFKVRDTEIAKKWYEQLSKNYDLFEVDRFTNWGDHNLVEEINKIITIINNYDNIIDRNLSLNFNQLDLNYLHKFFEDLRGDVTEGTLWFNNAPKSIKNAVEKFNVLIHKLEANTRTTNHPTVVVTFKNRPILDLNEYDFKHFTYRWTKGTVYINYCQVGKTVLDVFKDNDKIAVGVRPQKFYSADFMVKFGPTTPYIFYLIRKAYINVWLLFQKFKFKNPNLGMIPVADILCDIDTKHLLKYNKVKSVICLK
jgi:hypothetical protein